jgi:hypothetical protein
MGAWLRCVLWLVADEIESGVVDSPLPRSAAVTQDEVVALKAAGLIDNNGLLSHFPADEVRAVKAKREYGKKGGRPKRKTLEGSSGSNHMVTDFNNHVVSNNDNHLVKPSGETMCSNQIREDKIREDKIREDACANASAKTIYDPPKKHGSPNGSPIESPNSPPTNARASEQVLYDPSSDPTPIKDESAQITPLQRWIMERQEPWAQAVKNQMQCKIGMNSWEAWKAMYQEYGQEALAAAAKKVKASERFSDKVLEVLESGTHGTGRPDGMPF